MNIRYWQFEQNGFRTAGASRPSSSSALPPGLPVLSGNYKVVYSLGTSVDSTMVTVTDDPVAGNRNEEKMAKQVMVDRLRKSNDNLVAGVDRLNEADEVIRKMETQLKDVPGKPADSLRKLTRVMKDSVKLIRETITGKPRDKQGYYGGFANEPTSANQLGLAYRYIAGKSIAPGPQEEMLLKNAEYMVNESLNRINNFFAGPWKNYRNLAEGTKLELFKDYQPISTN